ncbi:hypothetical protein DQ04_04171010 [Trypanosoma grayi]|uniref:hypothetical protein n=1 Tax=Trypanosoma grayi TaxID=71804 RepID=UPI0004F44569|nr:hypothetical protein DQ04_04171010 [Trypanosoma grayi]KEG10101.1 hypothetical protein DQ04_04171010 [Trypanosoma grayi]
MIPIGLAFANIQRVDDLYPFVFHFNEDASCELIQAPTQDEDPSELLLNGLQRSVAIHTLQQLHVVPYFGNAVSEWVRRFLARSQQNLENCLVALAILGGEKSCEFCQHKTYGAVVLDSISDVASKAIVCLEADGDMRLFSTSLLSLKPSFVSPPIFSLSETESLKCSTWLLGELCRSLYEASVIVPLLNCEEERRREIEDLFFESTTNTMNLDFVGLLCRGADVADAAEQAPPTPLDGLLPRLQSTSASFKMVNGRQVASATPVTVDKRLSSNSLFAPNPSIGVTSRSGYSVIRGNVLLEDVFSFAVSITTEENEDFLWYVGVSSETRMYVDPRKVALCKKTWALCCQDSTETNNINCSVEPGMIISAEHILFGSGDIVIVQVDRGEGTVSFSRIRCGKRVDFGVLFETIPSKEKLRPFILAGPNSVVVFSFLGCSMFPSRSIFPPSSVTSWKNSSSSMRCSSCEVDLESFWYEGEGGICLCRDCFTCWKYPKAMFHLSQAEVPVSDYLVSQHSPRKLLVDSFVEFVEDTVFTWVDDKSVNVDIEGSICVARRDTAFASLETFNAFGNQRIDVCLGHVAGVDGFSFGGLQPFSPLWRIENTSSVRCSVDSDMLLVSSSVIPHGTKVVMELKFSSEDESRTLNAAGIFIGVTNLLSDYRTISMAELERRIANHNMWGTWCDTRKKISPSLTVWLLVDMTRGSIMVSSSLSGLYMHPVVVTCNCPVEEEANLRVAIFSHDRCHVTSCSGFVSLNDSIVRPSPSPLAIGLVPENVMDSNCEVINTSCFLFDTLARTTTQTAASWELAPLVHQEETDVLFSIGDTITIVQEQLILTVYRNGLLIATQTLSEEFLSTPQRFVVYFSTRGMIATTVPPLYGKSHLGKVIRTYGTEIGIVECICPCQGNRRYAVRRKEVRYCALPADTQTIDVGTRVAFKAGSLNVPKRGTVMSIENNAANIRDDEEKRTWFSVEMGCIYLLENEGPEEVSQGLYPLLTLPSSSITRVFEVGKTKYRLQRNGSYNGIMFDVQAHNPVVLTGLSVLTYTTGRHRVEVFFKKGSHHTHEREAGAWTKVFSNLVEMHSERQFTITFPGIQAEANTTFSLYINATHNCGVGHYSKEDGCTGAISNKMDSDGTLTVFVGRTSESSSPFFETSSTPRGFCGSIMYMQSMDTRPPLVERISSSSVETPYTNCDKNSNTVILRSHPVTSSLASTAEFVVEVIGGPIVIRKLYLPMLLDSSVRQCVGSLQLRVSLFYAPMDSHADAQEKERRWVWAYHAVMPLRSDTCWFRMEDMEVFLKRGNYIFNAVCEKDVGGVGVGRGEGGGERLACFLKAKEESYTVKNKVYSVRGLAGEIHATVTNNVIISDDLCVISTGGHLNQNNSASYNGIMFDIRSKRDILLEEVFCVAQTTTDNVNVKVFWKEGSIEGAEKTPSQWQQVVAKDLYLADKQPFSPGLLNLQLRANQMYALYINTTSSCGVRFYNSSDGHVGDVGDEFEDDGVVTVFVGKKSESPLPFSEIPAEPRALRGRITYRAFMQEISLGLNQAIFPALKGFVVARILAALIAYAGGTTSCTTPFEDSTVIETLAKLATPKTNAVCDAETAGNLLSSMMKESLVEELREGILTLSLSGGDMANFSSFAKGDLALVAKDGHASSTGRLVRLLEDPDENSCVVVKDETVATNHYSLSLDSLLPIIECQDCHQPFGTTRICGATGKKHMPLSSEEDQLINILIKYFSQRGNVSSEVSSAQVRSLVQDPASCAPCFDERLTNVSKRAHCLGVVRDGHTVEYTVPLDILSKGKEDGVVAGFVSHFLYSESMKAYVSLSFTPTVDSWSVVFLCDLPYRLAADTPVKVFLVSLAAILQDGSKEDLLSSPATYYVGRGGKIHQPLSTLASSLHYSCLQRDGCIHLCLNVQEAPLPSLTPSVPTPRERWLWANGSDCVELQPTKASLLNGCFGNAMWSKDKPRFCQLTVTSETNDNVFFLEAQVTISKTVSKLLWDEGRKRVIHRSFSISRDEELNLAFTVDGDFVVYDEDDSIRCHVAFDDLQLSSTKSLPPTIAIVNVGSHPVKAHLQCQNFAKPRKMMDRSGNWSTELGSYSPEWVSYDPLKVIVSKNGLTASCNGASGQAVIGSHLPVSGLSAFVVRIERSDRARGDSLGAGHFAGIVVSTFDELAPHFEMLRNRVNSIWAVQDVYDTDSLPTQERMPPISASGDELFLAGTKLRFLLNREDGTLSLARDNESPRVVFRNIPPNIPLSPFVRLDHARASATLAPLSCGAWGDGGGVMTPPSMMFTSHPVTPSILRRFPYSVVLSMFAVFRGMIGLLPSVQVSVIEDTWDNRFLSTRFGYRLSVALQSLVELGAFSRTMAHASEEEVEQFCSRTEMQKIINDLSQKPDKSVVVLRDANNIGDDFVLLLPDRYEVVGRIENSFMVRLWHFGDDGPSERTLHVFRLDDSEACVKACNVVTKHPCVMYQEEIVEGVKGTSCCGVITHGWYDCTLSSISMMKFNEHQQGVIAKSIMGALEHWHLHCLPHGHVSPENIYLRLSGNDVISCVLWDAHYVERHHKGASPRLRSHGIRDMKGDRWSCAHILSSFASFLSENTTFGRAVELMKNTEKNISEVLDETGTLAEESKKTVDGPVLCLRIGTNLKEGAGSYNGIMFDLVAKRQRIKVTKLSFFPDTNSSARVSLFVRDGTFMGVETERQKWRLALQRDMELVEKVETEVAGFYPINIPPGEHVAFFLHTTSGGGVLFYSEADGVRANMGAVEEENEYIGITVGKKSESVTPFMGIQNQKRVLKGSITYALSKRNSGYRSQIVASPQEVNIPLGHRVGRPVLVFASLQGLILGECEETCLVYFVDGHTEWVQWNCVKEISFNESPVWEELEKGLQQRLLERRRTFSGMLGKCSCNRQLHFHKTVQTNDMSGELQQRNTWWVSDPIRTTSMVSVWQVDAQTDATLFVVTSPEGSQIDFSNGRNILEHGQTFFFVEEWSRSVTSSVETQVVIKQLQESLSKSPLYLVVGPVKADAGNVPVSAFLSIMNTALAVKETTDTTAVVSLDLGKYLQENFVLNGAVLSCCTDPPKPPVFTGTSSITWHRGVRVTQIPSLKLHSEIEPDQKSHNKDDDEGSQSEMTQFFVELQPREGWIDSDVILHVQSQCLEVSDRYVQQIDHGDPPLCVVTKPTFGGPVAHEVELLILSSIHHPVQITFQHSPTSWIVSVPLPVLNQFGESYLSPSASVRNIHLRLFVLPCVKRVLASVDGGVMYEVLPGISYPSEFHLAFSLSGPGSSVRILRWRMMNKAGSAITRETLETIWAHLKPFNISPNISHTVGVLTRHSRTPVGAPTLRSGDMRLVSQIEAVIISYARQLLGTVVVASKPSKVQKRLQSLLPFTPLRGDLVALESLVSAGTRRASFFLIGEAYACLATPAVGQSLETVETSVNIIYASLNNDGLSRVFSTAYGSTLILLLLRTATVYTRSVRHVALRSVLKLLKTPHCDLPSHETLCASFAPLLGMMNGLCRKGKMSSVVVQLGISLICELIRRYQLERPTLVAPGKNSAVPYAIVTCTKVAIGAITRNPPVPLPEAFTQEPKETHRIIYELRLGPPSQQGFKSSYGVFTETFRCTFGTKKFRVVLGPTRSGSVVVGWDMDAVLPGSRPGKTPRVEDGSPRVALPSSGYFIEPNGKIFICINHTKELQPLKVRAKAGDVIAVKCLYHEQVVIIDLYRSGRSESTTRFETYPNEMLALPVFYAEREGDATFDGESLSEVSTGMDVAQLYNDLQQYPDRPDTAVIPQSYAFYAELALYCQSVLGPEESLNSVESAAMVTAHSHDLAGFPLLSAFLGVSAFSTEVPLHTLVPYVKRLKIFDVLTSVFSVVVDLRRKTELFDLWNKLKGLCSAESSEKIQNETMRPFRNRPGNKARVIIHTMQAHPSARLGPYPTLMRSIFGQLFVQLQGSPISTFYASPMFTVKLAGFGSTDAGGPYRDVLSQLATEVMTTHPSGTFQLNPLFAPCGRGGQSAVMPNVALTVASQSSLMFEFFGKLLAACFVTKDLLAVEFPPLFWKFLLSEETSTRDLVAMDPDILRQLTPEELMDRTADELEERFPGIQENWMMFCAENPEVGAEIDFPPNNTPSAELLAEQISMLELHRYDTAMGYIQHGFDEVIPLYTLNAFRWQQVELGVCGTPKLSYDALRKVCEVGLPAGDAQMFLEVISSMTDEDRMLLLRFTTGQTRLPLREAIKVQRGGAHNSLPTSSTCFFTLRLPSYSSADAMRERILYAVRQCKAIDTDGQAREHIVLDS